MRTQDHCYQVNCSLPMFTGIPEDVIVNTFHFTFDNYPVDPTVTDIGKVFDRLKTLYDGIYGAVNRANYTTAVMTMKAYDLQLPLPHVPRLTGTRTLAGAAIATSLPTETAICLSMKANYIGGVAQARQRGRIYIGGVASPLTSSTASTFPEVTSAARTAIAAAASTFRAGLIADGWRWVILSGAQVSQVLQNTFEVAGGWVDNSPDTQRRRSVGATARTVW